MQHTEYVLESSSSFKPVTIIYFDIFFTTCMLVITIKNLDMEPYQGLEVYLFEHFIPELVL